MRRCGYEVRRRHREEGEGVGSIRCEVEARRRLERAAAIAGLERRPTGVEEATRRRGEEATRRRGEEATQRRGEEINPREEMSDRVMGEEIDAVGYGIRMVEITCVYQMRLLC
ncbi:Os06g0539900 [Oryza sativa Japonica Group]|uniref:Os06g0539900 protein n=1 Tax=Oryza sativa subsp. japonica TaxID=39947 RepID=A0A0P0WXJ4_ORYSJ|nr:Os06g0539900 [Oryza sativa Japonica Group]